MSRPQEARGGGTALAAGAWSEEQIRLIREQIAPEATPGELALFIEVARSSGLDPFRKQIHAVHRWDGRKQRKVMAIQVGIDGYRAIAARTGDYAGNDDPTFETGDRNHPYSATATVYRIVKGVRCPFSATARWDEYKGTGKGGKLQPMWKKMPFLMLGKCAEALALRKAFPDALAGIYTDEEMDQAGEVIPVDARDVTISNEPVDVGRAAGEDNRATDAQRRDALALCGALATAWGVEAAREFERDINGAQTRAEIEQAVAKARYSIASAKNKDDEADLGPVPSDRDDGFEAQ